MPDLITKIGGGVGRFLSNFTYVLAALLIYCFLSLVTFLWVVFEVQGSMGKKAFITYEIATGGDPFNFSGDLQQYPILWGWILVFHVVSWLIVPVLAGTAVSAAFNIWEQRKIEINEELFGHMLEALGVIPNLSEEDKENIITKARRDMEKDLKERKKI